MTISMTLRLEEDLACRVRLVARLEGVSQAEIARRSLRRDTGHKLRDGDADEGHVGRSGVGGAAGVGP